MILDDYQPLTAEDAEEIASGAWFQWGTVACKLGLAEEAGRAPYCLDQSGDYARVVSWDAFLDLVFWAEQHRTDPSHLDALRVVLGRRALGRS